MNDSNPPPINTTVKTSDGKNEALASERTLVTPLKVSHDVETAATREVTERFLRHIADLRKEVYVMTDHDGDGSTYRWDVTEGLRLAEERNADIVSFFPAEHGVDAAHVRKRYPELNEEYVRTLSESDLSRPLLFIPFQGRSLLVDGWVRHEIA